MNRVDGRRAVLVRVRRAGSAVLALASVVMGGARAAEPLMPAGSLEGVWTGVTCDTSATRARCGEVRMALVERGGELCGTHFANTANLARVDEGGPRSVVGHIEAGRGFVGVSSTRDAFVRLVVLERIGERMRWREVADTGSSEASVLPDEAMLVRSGSPASSNWLAFARAGCGVRFAAPTDNGAASSESRQDIEERLEQDPLAVSYVECMAYRGGSALGAAPCYLAEQERLGIRLAAVEARIQHLLAGDPAPGVDAREATDALRRAQAHWRAYADADCAARDAVFGMGNARGMAGAECELAHLWARLDQLEEMRRLIDDDSEPWVEPALPPE